MNDRPIIFSGPMVRAILEDRKTQTRRLIKPPPDVSADVTWVARDGMHHPCRDELGRGMLDPIGPPLRCRQGERGDRLWVKESWCPLDSDHLTDLSRPKDVLLDFGPKHPPRRNGAAYAADEQLGSDGERCRLDYGYTWRSSRYMPRWASRITLEITDVRVQRLQDIFEDDAVAEGIERSEVGTAYADGAEFSSAKRAFSYLWDGINAKRASWESNPWVWAISFRRVP